MKKEDCTTVTSTTTMVDSTAVSGEESTVVSNISGGKTFTTSYQSSSTHVQWPKTMGRDYECQVIVDAVLRVYDTKTTEILHVHGASGTGKSSAIQIAYELALEKLDIDSESSKIAWVSGKYDEQLEGARPFSAFLDAVTALYDTLDETTITAIKETFNKEELADLSAVIPLPIALQDATAPKCTETNPDEDNSASDEISVQKNDSNQFKTFLRLFRRMLALICSHYNCVAVLLDDVQWMDDVSKELLEAILSEDKLTNFLFIASQRTGPEEPDFAIPETKFKITNLEIALIQDFQMNDLIAAALNMPPSETQDLASVVHRRAGGNTLFVVQFVELLCSKSLIARNASGQFEWDLDLIATKTQSTGNVADILVKKLTSLPFEIQIALIIAAHLGFRFKGKVLMSLLENTELLNMFTLTDNQSYSFDRYVTTLYSGLDQAKRTGLVEVLSEKDEYRFAHDRIQKSARTLLPKGKAGDKILTKLGTLLLERIETNENEPWMVFAATKLLTKHAQTDAIGKTRMAKLCLQAATMARKQSAHRQSAKYAETGFNKLGKQAWAQEYMLALKLSCVAAEMYFAAGNLDSSMSMVKKIEENAICVEHCFRAYNVLEEILGAQADHVGCIRESRKRLACLGVHLPKKAGQGTVLTTLLKTKLLLKGRSAKDLENLPPMTDEKKRQAIRMMGHVGEACWMIGDHDGCACTCLIMLQTVLKYGVCSEGVYAFTAYGVVLGHLGDIKECAAFFNLSRKFAEKDKLAMAMSACTEHNMGAFLTKDIANSPPDLMRASKVSASIGDIYRAGYSLKDVCPIGMFAGFRLNELQENANYCVEFFKDYEQQGCWQHISPSLQFVGCMRGETEDPTVLSGTFVDRDKIYDLFKDINNLNSTQRVLVLNWHCCQNFILLIHNEPAQIIEEVQNFKHVPEEMGSNYQKIINCFNCALAHYSLAAVETKKLAHHRGKARNYAKVVKKYSVAGSPMLKTMLLAIDAEEAAMNKKKSTADTIELYEHAIKEFGRQRMYLYKAIMLERVARYASDDKALSLRFFQDAYKEYELYGAAAKIAALEMQNPSFKTSSIPESVMLSCNDDVGDSDAIEAL